MIKNSKTLYKGKKILLIVIGLSVSLLADSNRFTRNDNTKIVTDHVTGLQWADNEKGRDISWRKAIEKCQNYILGGYDDWRVPNVNELRSIVDLESSRTIEIGKYKISLVLDPAFKLYPDLMEHRLYFWSSTSEPGSPNFFVYVVSMKYGHIDFAGYGLKDHDTNPVRCVRGGV